MDLRFFRSIENCKFNPSAAANNANHPFIEKTLKDDYIASPCDSCDNKRLCSTQHLACRRFAAWTNSKAPSDSLSSIPSEYIYNQIFQITKPKETVSKKRKKK